MYNAERPTHKSSSFYTVPFFFFALQSYYSEPSIQQKILGLLVSTVCIYAVSGGGGGWNTVFNVINKNKNRIQGCVNHINQYFIQSGT